MMLWWRAQQIFNATVTKMYIYVGLQDLYDPWQEKLELGNMSFQIVLRCKNLPASPISEE